MEGQIDILETPKLILKSEVKQDEITNQVSKSFDYEWNGITNTKIDIPNFPNDYQIGLIVGSSGSGKSTILKEKFGTPKEIEWDNSKAICSHFKTFEEASSKFGAVGLNSIPTWLKPYNVLSNGEKFRADMSRQLISGATIDEFTSVVNREVAISCSVSIEKYIRNNGIKNVTFCSCHDDIIPYLKPNWVYDTDTKQFFRGIPIRQEITIKFRRCSTKMWSLFKDYHYLSGDINEASVCYVGEYNNIPIVFMSLLSQPGKDVKNAWREHRLVVLPDYQGMGIGNKTSEMFGQAYIEKGCQYFGKTANPRIGVHRDNSPLWKATCNNHKDRKDYLNDIGKGKKYSNDLLIKHANRICYSHQFIGNGKTYPYTLNQEIEQGDVAFQFSLF